MRTSTPRLWLPVPLVSLLGPVVSGDGGECESFCGSWACPFDYCSGCDFEQCDHSDLDSGTPSFSKIADFTTEDEAPRVAPPFVKTGLPLPDAPNSQLEVKLHFDLEARGHDFTTYHIGTNIPLYAPNEEGKKSLGPALAAAGVRVWRWPGGAATNFWCPSFDNETWDECFDDFPIFKYPDLPQGRPVYPTSPDLMHLSPFLEMCAANDCIPVVQINAGIALRYGIEKCVDIYSRVLNASDAKGVKIRHLEFGNEMFGWWAAPYGYEDGFRWDAVDYGLAFSAVRRRLLELFPSRALSFGLVVNDDPEAECRGSHICFWNERMLDETPVLDDADWLSVHRYFTDYTAAWAADERILSSGPPMLNHISATLAGYFKRRGAKMPPIALTEYNAVFRQTPACGGSQQFISLLWQAKFIGDAVVRDRFKMMNHFAARAIPVRCTGTSDFQGCAHHRKSNSRVKAQSEAPMAAMCALLCLWQISARASPSEPQRTHTR